MRVIEHFSVYPRLPILIDEVADFILECGYVEKISWHGEEETTRYMTGMLYHSEYSPPYAAQPIEVAHICYNETIDYFSQRLVCAKELLHICDSDAGSSRSPEIVNRLVREMALPSNVRTELASMGKETVNDHAGFLRAVALLFPIEARDDLKPLYDQDKIGVEGISKLVEIPTGYAYLAMTDEWPEIYKMTLDACTAFCK